MRGTPVCRLKLSAVCKTYGESMAVSDLSLEMHSGELLTLLGPSGCGKTSTLRMIAGFAELTSGSISIDGKELSGVGHTVPPERRGMAMIFQSYAIWPTMTVAQNVAFGLSMQRTPAAEAKRRVDEMLDIVRLRPLAGRYPAELSGGQQQRVALARAMVVRPTILLLDEPLSNLDAGLREEMAGEIRRLHDEFGFTTVYVTHDQSEAMSISDRIAVLNHGRLEQIDTPWNLYNRPRTEFVAGFIGRTNLLRANLQDGQLTLIGMPVALPLPDVPAHSGEVRVSIRPQSLFLGAGDVTSVMLGRVRVASRIYLGEHWSYGVQAMTSGVELKVHAVPSCHLDVGQEIDLWVDPRAVVVLGQ